MTGPDADPEHGRGRGGEPLHAWVESDHDVDREVLREIAEAPGAVVMGASVGGHAIGEAGQPAPARLVGATQAVIADLHHEHTVASGQQVLDILHYVTSVGWVGIAPCQLTLNVVALTTGAAFLRQAAHQITHTFDRVLLIALGSGSLVTGVLLGLKTKWGLVRYWWVLVKLVLTLAVLIFGGVWMGAWITEAIALSAPPAAPADAAYVAVRDQLMRGSISNVLILLFITVVSVTKPWGRTWFGRRPARDAEYSRQQPPSPITSHSTGRSHTRVRVHAASP